MKFHSHKRKNYTLYISSPINDFIILVGLNINNQNINYQLFLLSIVCHRRYKSLRSS